MKRKRNSFNSLEAVKEGFHRFHEEHGHFPTASEIDDCPYLCSARWIQLRFGGLRKFRHAIGLEVIDYKTGLLRSETWKDINRLSIETEGAVKEFLIKRYGELCVHEEMKYGNNLRQRVDFFIYAKKNFAVDVFNTYTLKNLNININIKLKKYRNYPFKVFFVVTGIECSQDMIDSLMDNKLNKLPLKIKCVTVQKFKEECIKNFPPLEIRIKYNKIYNKTIHLL
jgi:hypothetical protein